jgi:hypothetical protein
MSVSDFTHVITYSVRFYMYHIAVYMQMGNDDDNDIAIAQDNSGNPLTSISATSDIEAAKSLTMVLSSTAKPVKQYDTAAGLPSFHQKVCAVQNNPQWIFRYLSITICNFVTHIVTHTVTPSMMYYCILTDSMTRKSCLLALHCAEST